MCSILGCGRDFTGPFGVVHYTNDDQSAETTECTWTVSPLVGSRIQLIHVYVV